jgi:hypothetical protein
MLPCGLSPQIEYAEAACLPGQADEVGSFAALRPYG